MDGYSHFRESADKIGRTICVKFEADVGCLAGVAQSVHWPLICREQSRGRRGETAKMSFSAHLEAPRVLAGVLGHRAVDDCRGLDLVHNLS